MPSSPCARGRDYSAQAFGSYAYRILDVKKFESPETIDSSADFGLRLLGGVGGGVAIQGSAAPCKPEELTPIF